MNKSSKIKLLKTIFTLPSLIFMASIVYLSNQSQVPPILNQLFSSDKLLHFCGYFVLGLSIQFAYASNFSGWTNRKSTLISFLTGSIFGLTDEIHQLYIPGRSCDIFDLAVDMLAVGLSLILFNVIKRFVWRKLQLES